MTVARWGLYEILSSLGEGGICHVYRARDTLLQRDIAIKVLPRHLASDPERLGREARLLAE
jgi:serine/threonine protein kinase